MENISIFLSIPCVREGGNGWIVADISRLGVESHIIILSYLQ